MIEPSSNVLKTRVTEVKMMPKCVPSWTVGAAASHRLTARSMAGIFETVRVAHERVRAWMGTQHLKNLPASICEYIVITLRKCTRGPPLLPRSPCNDAGASLTFDPDQWIQSEKGKLSDYLRVFLGLLGVEGVTVHGSLHGWNLVAYQAAVSTADWAMAWSALERPFRVQRAAYRRVLRGECAPQLDVGSQPRFQNVKEPQPMPALAQEQDDRVPVRGTFVHFALAGAAASSSRCGSSPPYRN